MQHKGESAMKESKVKLKGRMKAALRKADGSVEYFERDNLIVDVGLDFICDAMAKASGRPAVLSYIGIGTGTTPADATDTALQTEAAREATTYDHDAGTNFMELVATFDAGTGTGDITEAGVFNAASSGTMLNRVVFSAIPKEASDSLDMSFTFTFTL